MAEVTRVSQEELNRREHYIREKQRPRDFKDPWTWDWPYKTAAFTIAATAIGANIHNKWMRKPWHYALYTRLAGTAVLAAAAFTLGKLRVYHYSTREAVTEHYKEIHAGEFEALDDHYGRQFSNVLLPWYPRRAQYKQYD